MDKKIFRVYLRALEPEDYLITQAWRNDPVYQAGVASVKRFISIDTEKRWIENAIKEHENLKALRLAVVLKETDEMVGMVFLTDINMIYKSAKVGSLIGSNENRGKGYITEARFLLFEYAFMELGLERISATILEDNYASIKSAERVGYVKEGVLRNAVYKDGEFKNIIAYSILRDEFITRYKSG